MKKILIFITIASIVILTFTACGSKTGTDTETVPEQTEEAVTKLSAEEVTEEAASVPDSTEASETEPETNAEGETEGESEAPQETPSSIEDIVAFYNTAVNKVKPQAKSITRTYHHVNIPTDSLELPSAIQGIGESAIKQFVKGSDEPEYWTTKEDFNLGFPVGGTDYSSKMTPDMVKSATCTDNGKTYTVKIVLKDVSIVNPKKGQGYAGVFNTVSASTFDDINIPTVTFEKVSIRGINGSIKCTIDKETQRVTDITFENTDILDLSVKVAFSNLHAKMNLVAEDN